MMTMLEALTRLGRVYQARASVRNVELMLLQTMRLMDDDEGKAKAQRERAHGAVKEMFDEALGTRTTPAHAELYPYLLRAADAAYLKAFPRGPGGRPHDAILILSTVPPKTTEERRIVEEAQAR